MFALSNEVTLPAPPARVWTVLVDLGGYPGWHPFIRFEGAAEPNASVDYIYTSSLLTLRARHAPARITRFDIDAAFEWRTGIKGFFEIVESYALAPDAPGTRLEHRVEYHGVVAAIFGRRIGRDTLARIRETDGALRDYLQNRKSANPARTTRRAGPAGKHRQ